MKRGKMFTSPAPARAVARRRRLVSRDACARLPRLLGFRCARRGAAERTLAPEGSRRGRRWPDRAGGGAPPTQRRPSPKDTGARTRAGRGQRAQTRRSRSKRARRQRAARRGELHRGGPHARKGKVPEGWRKVASRGAWRRDADAHCRLGDALCIQLHAAARGSAQAPLIPRCGCPKAAAWRVRCRWQRAALPAARPPRRRCGAPSLPAARPPGQA